MAHGAIGHCQHHILASAIPFGHDIQSNHIENRSMLSNP